METLGGITMAMESSILKSVKQMLGGISSDNTAFDPQLILFINSVMADLQTLGAIPDFYEIYDNTAKWEELDTKEVALALIKPFVFLKVKMLFDPPVGGAKEALENLLAEYEWRIRIACESSTFE